MVGHIPLEDGIGVRVPAPQPICKVCVYLLENQQDKSWYIGFTSKTLATPTRCLTKLSGSDIMGLELKNRAKIKVRKSKRRYRQ